MRKKGESPGRMISDLLAQALGEDKLRKSEFNITVNVKPGQCLLPVLNEIALSLPAADFNGKS